MYPLLVCQSLWNKLNNHNNLTIINNKFMNYIINSAGCQKNIYFGLRPLIRMVLQNTHLTEDVQMMKYIMLFAVFLICCLETNSYVWSNIHIISFMETNSYAWSNIHIISFSLYKEISSSSAKKLIDKDASDYEHALKQYDTTQLVPNHRNISFYLLFSDLSLSIISTVVLSVYHLTTATIK